MAEAIGAKARRRHFLSGTATGEGSVGNVIRPRENFFTFLFQLSGLALVAP